MLMSGDGTVAAFNRAAEALLGYHREELLGTGGAALFEDAIPLSGDCEAAERNAWQERRAKHKDGRTLLLAALPSPVALGDARGHLVWLRPGRDAKTSIPFGPFAGLVHQCGFPVIYADESGTVRHCNDAFAKALNLQKDSLCGRTLDALGLHPQMVTALRQALSEATAASGAATPLREGAQESEISFWDWCVSPSGDRRRGKSGALLLMADATARMRAEHAFHKSTLEWTYAMDAFDDAIYLLDLNERVVRANRAFYQLTKLTPEQAIGRKITSIMHPLGEDSPCAVCKARAARQDCYIVMEADDPSNKTGRPHEIMVRMIRDDTGQAVGVLMAMHDLSRSRQQESEFRRLNEHIRLLLSATGEGIFGIDREGRCTFVNRAAAAMLGYSAAELQHRDLHGLIHHSRENGQPLARDEVPMLQSIRDRCSFKSVQEVLWRKDGSCFPVQYMSNPVLEQGEATGAVVVFRDITENRAMTRRLDYLAKHDTLTGLLNRHEFERRLAAALRASQEKDVQHVLCYCDLDQFKVVNDTCGHAAGDQLLNQLSALLRVAVPPGATLARLGGDEFGLLFENCSVSDARAAVRTVRETVRDFRFVWEDKTFAIGVSIGVVPIDASTGTPAQAMSIADAACYMAKDSGRNRLHVYQPGDTELSRRHREMQWVTGVQDALESGRLFLAYQSIRPTQGARDNPHYHFEILVRMWGPSGDVISPEVFIPAAERYNVMPAIDRWVVSETCRWFHRHLAELADVALCTINLSGQSLTDEGFLDFVVTQLRDNRVPPAKICFEITETAAVAHLGHAVHFIGELRTLGCRFALDDFGSGVSSFAYLKNLPVDYLKIDGNFVRDIADDPVDFAMVEAINRVGHVMGLQTIAEFVESEAVLGRLREIGVDFVQGFALGPPQRLDILLTEIGAVVPSY